MRYKLAVDVALGGSDVELILVQTEALNLCVYGFLLIFIISFAQNT